jgi:hypothetical protein
MLCVISNLSQTVHTILLPNGAAHQNLSPTYIKKY